MLGADEYRALVQGASRNIFRLQIHPVYKVAAEEEEFEQFLATGTYDIDADDEYFVSMRQDTAAGKTTQRVYVSSPHR